MTTPTEIWQARHRGLDRPRRSIADDYAKPSKLLWGQFRTGGSNFQSLMLRVLRAEMATPVRPTCAAGLLRSCGLLKLSLQWAGLLEKVRRVVYRITDEGRKVLVEQPERIDMRFLERYPAHLEWLKTALSEDRWQQQLRAVRAVALV